MSHDYYDKLPDDLHTDREEFFKKDSIDPNCKSLMRFARMYDLKPRKDDSDESHFDELDE